MHHIFLLATLALAFTAVAGSQPSVTIENGTVRGVDLPQFGQSLFLGIPYAQPPVGNLRLRPPRSVNASFGTLDATAYGPHCWSRFTTGFDDNSGFNNSEDCLTLNVIRPGGVSPKSPVPVVVWIHGGGLLVIPETTGGSGDFRYNGSWIVQASVANGNPIVFVSLNYRLASLGFLAGKALEDEGSLNLGARDQRLALHWVQENIAQFGGDPKKVTIQGESSGATSVHTQIIAYAGRDDHLFNQAIAESGTNGGNFSLPDDAAFQATYNGLIANTSCASTAKSSEAAQLSCIRSLPIDVFRQNSLGGSTGIVFDGDFINVPGTFEAYRTGKWVKVAFLVGSNTDEGRSFAALGANTTAQANASLTGVPPQFRDAILNLYPDVPSLGCPFSTGDFQLDPIQNGVFNTPGLQNKRVAAIVGDVSMAAGPRWLAQEVSSEVPFYKYRFNHKPYSVTFSVEDFIGHFIEVSYVFNLQNNDIDFWLTNHFTATYLGPSAPIEDRFLGVYMSRSWASFIATGDPNNANVTSKITWPKYSDGQENIVWQTQGSITEKDNYREAGMKFIMDNIFF
ncbi:Alpha/Beta hydrolase protein [Mycena rosella]|uniref:Carboxylic ester hydrolase n=1 Tax=Mycena rosella TaxID=1033263 RepID=A0AAD7G8L6_MYCRO|nr:Alpha/Beta hydrolase protein [Mycena rosella]